MGRNLRGIGKGTRLAIAASVALFWASSLFAQERFNVGTSTANTGLMADNIPVRFFYPTDAEMKVEEFGPWEIMIAKSTAVSPGQHPVIFIAHGFGGNSWNHHLLARELAARGNVVAAPHFREDHKRNGSAALFHRRAREFRSTVEYVLKKSDIRTNIDPDRVGAFGYSLGGFTALQSAGARYDANLAIEHCQQPENDPKFCDIGEARSFHVEAVRDILRSHKLQAVVLAAPLGVIFTDLKDVTAKLWIIRAGADEELRFPYHAERIHQLIGKDHDYLVIDDLHHYAFLSPFPASIANEVGDPAVDPDGFNREVFLLPLNQDIADFFDEALSPMSLSR